ncbi:MAG: HEAT repeat domain-containing protein [Candidatus Deferrimicrobiaceae bacterium]
MERKLEEKAAIGIGPLVQALAKTYHWAGLYGTDHPILAKRVKELHTALLSRLSHEPEKRLLLGIARDKVLYRNEFVGEKQDLVGRLTESLYLRQVATLGFDPAVTPESLLALFRYLHESIEGKETVSPEQFLRESGIRGVSLSPYNYRELLSRKILDPDATGAPAENREQELWRLLLTSDFTDRGDEMKIMDELTDSPTLLNAILRRAKEAETREEAPGQGNSPVSGEVLRSVLGRLSTFVRNLPTERKQQFFTSIGPGIGEQASGATGEGGPYNLLIARSLTEMQTDEEFLDLVATLVSLEGKGGERLRKSFAILAGERNAGNSLIAHVGERMRESKKAKDYYAQKTWETVEKLILSRGEEKYIQDDHYQFLEDLTAIRKPYLDRLGAKTCDDLGVRNSFEEKETRRRTLLVLLEILRGESQEEDFRDILEDFLKAIPNFISQNDFTSLHAVLLGLESISATTRTEWQNHLQDILHSVDFGYVGDLYLSGEIEANDAGKIQDLLVRFGGMAAQPLLDRLHLEPEAVKRRSLIRLLTTLGPTIVPDIISRLSHPKWYFVRNLCVILGDIGDRQAVESLLQATSRADYRVKREAIMAIGKLSAPEAVPGLGKILADEKFFSSKKEDQIRIDAANSLYQIGGTEAIAFLHRGTSGRRTAVRSHCKELLGSLPETR